MQKETRREIGEAAIRALFLSFTAVVVGCADKRQPTRSEFRASDIVGKPLQPEDLETAESNRGWTVVDPNLPPNTQLARVPANNRLKPDYYFISIDGMDTGIGVGHQVAHIKVKGETQRTELITFTLNQDSGTPIRRFFRDNPGKDPSKPQTVLFVNRHNPAIRYYVEIIQKPTSYEFYLLEPPEETAAKDAKTAEVPQSRMLGRIDDEKIFSTFGWTVGYPALASHQQLAPQLLSVQRIVQVQNGEILVAGQKTGIAITQTVDAKTQQLRTFIVITQTTELTARAVQTIPTVEQPDPRIIQLRSPNQRDSYFLKIPERIEQSFYPQVFTLTQ